MSVLTQPTPVKYFYSCLYNTDYFTSDDELLNALAGFVSELNKFEPSFNPLMNYYAKEMGDKLKRVIFFDHSFRERDEIVGLKKKATAVEQKFSKENRRLINIDVGYVAKEHVILATGKPYSHRVYLQEGVYAELVYTYQDKTFKSLPWTYPDYQHEEKIQFFNQFR